MAHRNIPIPRLAHRRPDAAARRGRRLATVATVLAVALMATGCEVPEGMDRPGEVPRGARTTASPAPMVPDGGTPAATGDAQAAPRPTARAGSPTAAARSSTARDAVAGNRDDRGLVATLDPVSFRYDPAVAASVDAETVEAQSPRDEPGEPTPRHIRFTLDGYVVRSPRHAPVIAVYGVDAYEAASPQAGRQIAALRALLADRPATIRGAADASNPLPFLPYGPSAELFHAQAVLVEFAGGAGVRYIAQRDLGTAPVTNADVFYTFQGLTDDGAFYISAVLPIAVPGLPDDDAAAGEAAEDGWDAYIAGVVDALEAVDGADVTPPLAKLDAMVGSIVVGR